MRVPDAYRGLIRFLRSSRSAMSNTIVLNTPHPAGRTFLAFSRDGRYVIRLSLFHVCVQTRITEPCTLAAAIP